MVVRPFLGARESKANGKGEGGKSDDRLQNANLKSNYQKGRENVACTEKRLLFIYCLALEPGLELMPVLVRLAVVVGESPGGSGGKERGIQTP